jgi:thioredoxin reductase (NADPH)
MEQKHNWDEMILNVQNHIKGLNWGYKSEMIKSKVKYFNAYAEFVDAHTIKCDNGKGKV